MAVEQDGFIIPDNVLELVRQRESRLAKPKPEAGIVKRAGMALADAAARFAAPVEGGPRERGGLTIEGKPYGAGDARVVAAPPPAPGSSVLDRPARPEMLAEQAPPSVEQGVADSVAPWRREQDAATVRYRSAAGAPNATAFSTPQNIAQNIREATDNPVARGAVAGVAQLGQTGVGAVRLAADLFGADKVADFAQGASNAAGTIGSGASADLRGSDKLVADVTSSILNSAPSLALATVGGPALSGLFVQSTLAEYNNGRDAGFDPGESMARAGIMGAAEAIGERFGLPEQVKLLRSIGQHVPTGQLAQVFGSMLAKEIPGEQLTTGLQFLADKAGPAALNPNATLADYLNQAGETLKLTVAQTAVMGGGPAALGATKAGLQRADAAVERSGRSQAENIARDRGLIRPTEMRSQAFGQLDDLAATHGIPSRVVKVLKEEADGKPLAGLGAWLQRALRNLAEDGHIAPVDDATLSALGQAPAAEPLAASPRFDAASILSGTPESAPSAGADTVVPGETGAMAAPTEPVQPQPPAATPAAADEGPPSQPQRAGFDASQLQTGQLLQIAQTPGFPPELQQAAAAEVRRRETEAMYADRDVQKESELAAVLDETRTQQADHAAAAGRAGDLQAPTAMQLALQRAAVKPIAGQPINRNWTAFSPDSGTLGIPREQMPQVSAEHRGALVNFLKGRGIQHQVTEIPATDLKPTQAEFSPQKVKGAADFKGGDRSILVSADGYVLDGHHQWMAKRDAAEPIKAIVLDAPIQDLLRLTHQFPSSTTSGGPRRSVPNAQSPVLPVADAQPAGSGDGRLPDAGGGLPSAGPAGQQLAGVGRATEAPGTAAEAPAALPDGPGPNAALTPAAEAPAADTALQGRGFKPSGPAPGEWVREVSPLGDVIAKVVSKPGEPLRAEISADYMGKRFDTRTAEGEAAIDEAIARAERGINEGRERLARTPLGDQPNKPQEIFAGNFGKGMAQHVAKVKLREFSRTRPELTWSIAEVPDDPKYEPGRYLLEGRLVSADAPSPQPAAGHGTSDQVDPARTEGATAPVETGTPAGGKGLDGATGTAVVSGTRTAEAQTPRVKPRRPAKHPDSVRGSQALAAISRSLGGISPQLQGDLTQKVSRERTSAKTGKKTTYTTWDNPAIPGVGPLFRAGGTSDLTELARVLEDEGYIPAGTLERDYLEARNLAQDIIKAELAQGGSSVRVGDSEAVDAEMTRRREEAMAAEADPWEDFAISPDDLDEAGFSKASPETKALTEQLMAEAQTLGIDTESIAERAALETESDTEDAYHERAQQLIRETVAQTGQDAAGRDAGAERGSSSDSGQAPGPPSPPRGDRPDGPDGALQAEGLTLTAPTPDSLKAAEKRKQSAAEADAKEQKRLADKGKADAEVGEFRLTGSNRPVDVAAAAGQEDLFAAPSQNPAPDPTPAPAPAAASPIVDAGEKIGGARKDRWKERGLDLQDLSEMSAAEAATLVNKANVWKPDWKALVAAGKPAPIAAHAKVIYDRLAAQPKDNTPDGRRRYVEMMQAVRRVYSQLTADNVATARDRLHEEVKLPRERGPLRDAALKVMFSVYKGRSDPFTFDYNDMAKVRKMVADGFPEKAEPWTRRYVIRERSGHGLTPAGVQSVLAAAAQSGTPITEEQARQGYFEVRNLRGSTLVVLPTRPDAEAAAKLLYERMLVTDEAGKQPERPHLDKILRKGLPAHADRDVSADDFLRDFGFRGVEFGNWAAQDERQRILNFAYDGLHDLADVLGVPPKALSLNGTLGMAFGARGGGRFAAHYEPGKLVINLTKLSGGGSMAHEWAHALDHYFGELDRGDAYQTAARGASGWRESRSYSGKPQVRTVRVDGKWVRREALALDNLRPELAMAFDTVMRTLFEAQVTKAEMLASLNKQIETTRTRIQQETDPQLKAVYERGLANQLQNLRETEADPEDATYSKGRSNYLQEAKKLSGKSEDGYWTRPTEMFARAFEAYVFDRMVAMGARSDYLVHGVEGDRFAGEQYKGNPYPVSAERAAIAKAFDKLVATVNTREDAQGRVALFSRRDSTPVDLPPVAIGGGLSLASLHPRYAAAKAGDAAAALELAQDVVSPAFVEDVRSLIGDAKPIVQPVSSIEESGRNKIPLAVAHVLADRLGLTVGDVNLQASKPKRTALDGLSRLFATPEFEGSVQKGAQYLLVDDTLTQGGTYAALASHVRQNGGQVVGAAALTGKRYSATIALSPQLLQQVRDRFADVETAFRAATGYGFDALTESEARYLAKHNAPDAVRARIAQERDQAGQRLDEGRAGQDPKPLSSRGAAPGGVDAEVLKDWAASTAKSWADAPKIHVAASVQALPGEIREWIASADAEGSVRALMLPDTNEVWLVASQLGSMQEAQFALFHEVFGHVGLRKVMGEAYETRLAQLRAANPALRAEARAWLERNSEPEIQARMGLGMTLAEASREVQFLAVEEALADRAGNPQDLTGWQRFTAALQAALRRVGLDAVANWIERATQAETLQLLADARDAVAGRPELPRATAPTPSAAPAFSRAEEVAGTSGPDEAAAVHRGYRERVNAALARVDHVVNGLGGLPDTDQFLAQRYRALGKIAEIDKVASEIRATFRKAAPDEKKAIYAYLTDAAGRPDTIPTPAVREMAVAVKGYINTVGDQLVARGLLPEAARDEYRDRYLPRLYLSHLLEEGDWRSIGAGKKVSDLGYLKRRKDIPQEIRDVLLGEVKDPAFLAATAIAKPMRDMALLDWLQQISDHQAWIYPQSLTEWAGKRVSPFWLRAEAAALRERARLYPEEVNREKAGRIADQMDALARDTLANIDLTNKDFKQLPDTARYGRLRGLLVRREIYDDLMGTQDFMPDDAGWAQRTFGYGGAGTKATQLWKMSKVALNIPGQIRNAVGNAVMLQLSGVPLAKMPGLMARAIREVRRGGPAWEVAKRYGVTESTFQAQELYRARRDLLELERDLKGMTPWLAIKTFATRIADLAGDAYQGTEAVFKTLKIMHGLDTGLSEERAALEAQKWLFDYSLIDRNLRYLRNAPVGAPFVTFSSKVLPRLAEVALLHPQRFLPWVGLMYGMQAWAQAVFGGDDDEWKHLKEALPKWMQDKGHIAFLPFRDDAGRLQAADLSYFFPWSQWTELGSNLAKGELGSAIKNFGIFSGPVTSVLVAVLTGKDSFTGRDIVNPNDPTSVQAAAYLAYAWDLAMPPMISSNGVVSPLWLLGPEYGGKLAQAATGATNRRGDPRATTGQAAARLVGLNVYGIDPVLTRQANLAQMATSIKLTRLQLRSKLSDQGLSAERKAEILADYSEKLKELAKEMDEYSKKSQVPDFARRERELAE